MFSFSGNLLAGQFDTQKDRSPPARPVPVAFPSLHPPRPSASTPPASWGSEATGITAHLLQIKKPAHVTTDTLALLNVTFQPECDLETFFSSVSNNAHSYLPPQSWLNPDSSQADANESSPDPQLLSNGRRAPEQRDFVVRLQELTFENADAFATLSRKRIGDQAPLRLAHFRKFWEGLDNMAYYWDNSLDEYSSPVPQIAQDGSALKSIQLSIDSKDQSSTNDAKSGRVSDTQPSSPSLDEPRKKPKIETNGDGMSDPQAGHVPLQAYSRSLPARIAQAKFPVAKNITSDTKPVDLSRGSYRGYRIGNGAEMPDQYRIDCVRAFLEPIAWAFGVTLSPHRRPPVLCVERVRFPVRMSSVAWRGPQDRVKARQGWLEGPVLGMQCRADLNFGASGDLNTESTLDAVRELGGLLLLAQERAREGRTETRAGEGKWWTTKERWGGGPGGEVGEATGAAELQIPKPEEKPAERNRDGSKVRRKPSPAEMWKLLKPGNPLWDPKVTYEAIGKVKGSEWDDVFMVSSLNHHISVVRLHVHSDYVRYITNGKLPEQTPSDPEWVSPRLQRTRWYDLFNEEDRKEAMRALWGLMSYLMRVDESPPAPTVRNSEQAQNP